MCIYLDFYCEQSSFPKSLVLNDLEGAKFKMFTQVGRFHTVHGALIRVH